MAPKYELLPSGSDCSPPSSRCTSPAYLPPYDAGDYEDVEHAAARRGRPRVPREPMPAFDSDPRFRQPTPSPYARAALIIFMLFLFWLAFAMRKALWIETGMGMGKGPVEEVDPDY